MTAPGENSVTVDTAQRVNGAWDAEVRIRRRLSASKPHVERVTCRKSSAKVAEERSVIYARRWVDASLRRQ